MTVILAAICLSGCTVNQRARYYGSDQTITLDKNYKVENATWKEDDLWILVRPMRPDEQPEKHTFFEHSNYGVLQGKVYIVEQK